MKKPKRLKKPNKVSLIINNNGQKKQIIGNLVLITMPDKKGIFKIIIEKNNKFETFTNNQINNIQELKEKPIQNANTITQR